MKNTHQFWFIAFGLVLGASQTAQACNSESYVGTICTVSFNWCPYGTLEANGQLVSINNNNYALFSLIGTMYGGDGRSNFALPDLRGRSVVGVGQGVGLQQNVILGQNRGSESVKLTLAQLPAHSHTATFNQTGSSPITVNIPVSTANGTEAVPTTTANKLAVANSWGDPIAMWTSSQTNPVNIGGVTTSGGSSGTVSIGVTGNGQTVPTVPPQLGMKQCVVTMGIYPDRP